MQGMDPRFRILGRRRRAEARDIARAAYLLNPKTAAADAERAVRQRYGSIIGMILVGLLVRLVVELIAYWIKQQVSTPPIYFATGEPGADE